MDGLAAGMEEVGKLFDSHEYFVPEVLMCADALYAGLDILKPHVTGRCRCAQGLGRSWVVFRATSMTSAKTWSR